MHSCAIQKRKNAEHTRMHTIFHTLSSQYSRRLLSILAPPKHKKNKKQKKNDLHQQVVEFVFFYVPTTFINNLTKKRSEKKCGAHTHAHHLSQLSYPIFTSVVVYSRTSPIKIYTNNNVVCLQCYYNTLRCLFIYTS